MPQPQHTMTRPARSPRVAGLVFVATAVASLLGGTPSSARPDPGPDEPTPGGRTWALLVGVSKYQLAAPLPVRIIVEMMGVPPEDRDLLRDLADKLLYLNRSEPYRMRPLTEGIDQLMEYVRPKVEERLEQPRNDFISILARGEKLGAFTRREVMVNTSLLLFAGHETTMNLICNGTLALLRHPAEWERFRQDPAGLAVSVTEECLRYDPPVKSTQRIAAQEAADDGIVEARAQL